MAQTHPLNLLSLRRLRQSSAIRTLTREVLLSPQKLIQPYFIVENLTEREAIPGLTGVYRETPDSLLRQVESDLETGCHKMLLFGVPAQKREASFHFDFTASQIAALKARFGADLFISVDVCLCSATLNGHCGLLSCEGNHIENASSVLELARAATEYAQAGADCVAPSDMMDGRIGAIRRSLDQAGLERTLILSYSAKFHSRFYGPFRIAADSAPQISDRSSYQIDPARPSDALLSALRDAEEGADILMVKPGLPYLDILKELSEKIKKPWAVYEVSGEYAAIELMAQQGLIHAPLAHLESWTAFHRAGAEMIITYGARNARNWLNQYPA